MPVKVPKDIQLAVDEYLDLYRQSRQIEATLKELRSVIEPYLKEHGETVEGTDGQGQIELTASQRPVMNAQYTTYLLEDLKPLLPASILKKCTVQVIDKLALEALGKLGQVPDEILRLRQTRESTSFTVRLK